MIYLPIHSKLLILTWILIILKFKLANCWSLHSLGIRNDTYKLKHISIYQNKSYLSIELNNVNSKFYKIPTLIESSWPEKLRSKNKIFPSINEHGLDDKNCNYIQQSSWTYADCLNRLWVFDVGNSYCQPKILIYDLLRGNVELHRIICFHFNYKEVASITAEPANTSENASDISLYVTLTNGKHILVYSLLRNTWRRLYFSFDNPSSNLGNIQNDVALMNLKIIAVAFNQQNFEMYVIDYFGKIYTTNYKLLKNQTEIPVKCLGQLLGKPNLIINDIPGNLYYNLPQYGSILKCNLNDKKDLTAENHKVIRITSDNLQQLIFDNDGRLWYTTSYADKMGLHCHQVQSSF